MINTRTRLIVALSVLGLSRATSARDGADLIQASAASLSGRVLDSGIGVGGVDVTATLVTTGASLRMSTDPNGMFSFAGVQQGAYSVQASQAGYVDAAYGRDWPESELSLIEVSAGQSLRELDLTIMKTASISGVITDGASNPMVNVKVYGLMIVPDRSGQRAVPVAVAATDANGAFRLESLVPADYLVAVPSMHITVPADVTQKIPSLEGRAKQASSPGAVHVLASYAIESSTSPDSPLAPQTTYFPSTSSPADAARVSLGSGTVRKDVDIRIPSVQGTAVTGQVVGPAGPAAFALIQLWRTDGDDANVPQWELEVARAISDREGRFRFSAVPPGRYVLKTFVASVRSSIDDRGRELLQSDYLYFHLLVFRDPLKPVPFGWVGRPPEDHSLSGVASITVDRTDVSTNIALTTAPRVCGQVVATGFVPIGSLYVRTLPALGNLTVDARAGWVSTASSFCTWGSPPDSYLLEVGGVPQGWHVRSALYQGRDRLDEKLDLRDDDATGVVVTMTRNSGTVAGVITKADGSRDPDAAAWLWPANYSDPGVIAERRFQRARASTTGRYAFSDVPAGSYFVVAVPASQKPDWKDSAVLSRLVGSATRLPVAETSHLVADLRNDRR